MISLWKCCNLLGFLSSLSLSLSSLFEFCCCFLLFEQGCFVQLLKMAWIRATVRKVWKFSTFSNTIFSLEHVKTLLFFASTSSLFGALNTHLAISKPQQEIQVRKRLLFCILWTFSFYAKYRIPNEDTQKCACFSLSKIFQKFTQLLNKNLFRTRKLTVKTFSWLTFPSSVPSHSLSPGGAVLKGCLQVGIISFGSIECGYDVPSVFTRIEDPAIRGFIRKHTGI